MEWLNIRRIACLGAVLIALAAYLLFWDMPAAHRAANPGEGMLIPFQEEQVKRIEIRRRGQKAPLVLERGQGGWIITSPLRAPADGDRVRGLLDVFKCGYIEVIGRLPQDISQYGLDQPESSITLSLDEKGRMQTRTVSFGANNPGNTSCYAVIKDDPRILMVGVLYKMELGKEAEYYRLSRP